MNVFILNSQLWKFKAEIYSNKCFILVIFSLYFISIIWRFLLMKCVFHISFKAWCKKHLIPKNKALFFSPSWLVTVSSVKAEAKGLSEQKWKIILIMIFSSVYNHLKVRIVFSFPLLEPFVSAWSPPPLLMNIFLIVWLIKETKAWVWVRARVQIVLSRTEYNRNKIFTTVKIVPQRKDCEKDSSGSLLLLRLFPVVAHLGKTNRHK